MNQTLNGSGTLVRGCSRTVHAKPRTRVFTYSLGSNVDARTAVNARDAVLEAFWESRGVQNPMHRQYLIKLGIEGDGVQDHQLPTVEADLLGANTFWTAQADEQQVRQVKAVSQRILKLQGMLGGAESGFDIVWAVTREPLLLMVDLDEMTRRLLEMKVATAGSQVDVLTLVQAQPSLLLRQSGQISSEAMQEVVDAWQHGVASVGEAEWAAQLSVLQAYVQQHGDAHAGARDGDADDLVRWVAKQRADYKAGRLNAEQTALLVALGFEFSEEAAEWLRWFNELKRSQDATADAPPLATGTAFLLTNWCSVQRIAARSGVLSQQRRDMLDSVGFDWTGADALS